MPNHLQAVRFDHPTNPHGLHSRCGLNRHPRIQLDGGNPRQRLLFPHVCHRTYLRKSRHREEVHEIRRFDVVDWRRDGILGNVLALVHRLSVDDLRITSPPWLRSFSSFSPVCIWRFLGGG